jgi:hypothetical protein
MDAYIKNAEKSQINYLMLHLNHLGKQEQAKPKISRGEKIKIRAKIYKIETKKQAMNQQN